jgi:hypothetical protein
MSSDDARSVGQPERLLANALEPCSPFCSSYSEARSTPYGMQNRLSMYPHPRKATVNLAGLLNAETETKPTQSWIGRNAFAIVIPSLRS